MIYGKSRNVVVIQNIDSGYVEQAILILKKDPGDKEYYASEEGIVQEAQRIIDEYTQSLLRPRRTQEPKRHRIAGFFLIAAAAVILTAFLLLK